MGVKDGMSPYYSEHGVDLYHADARALPIADDSVQMCVTSPPYFGLRDYGVDGQIGLEQTPDEYVATLVGVFREVRRVLKNDGTLWLNLGDSYNAYNGNRGASTSFQAATEEARPSLPAGYGLTVKNERNKDLLGIPWRVAFAIKADGWYLRSDIIWHKPNPMPESVTDRPTRAHEYLFLLAKSDRYYYDSRAIMERVADTSLARWRQPNIDGQVGSDRVPGKNNGTMKAVGGPRREQAIRAVEIAREKGLTDAHIAAIRSVGITDAGKALKTQSGCGRNDPVVQSLADEAKVALGGYYREFLIAEERNRRSVWTVPTKPYAGAHFATFPPDLIKPCILAGSRPGDVVLDCFNGSGTSAQVSRDLGRRYVGVELNAEYLDLTKRRLSQGVLFGAPA